MLVLFFIDVNNFIYPQILTHGYGFMRPTLVQILFDFFSDNEQSSRGSYGSGKLTKSRLTLSVLLRTRVMETTPADPMFGWAN